MGNRKISNDIKEAALRMKSRGYNVDEILDITSISESTLYRTACRKRLTGTVAHAKAIGRGRPRILFQSDCQYLLRLARHKPSRFLDEYAHRLELYRFLPVSLATLHRTFKRAGLSVKRLQKLASERDPLRRADFIRQMAQYVPMQLLFLDETSKDDRTYARLWGRSPRGLPAEEHNPFVRKRRFSMVATLALDEGIIAARVVEGSYHRDTYMEYLRDDVVRGYGCSPISFFF